MLLNYAVVIHQTILIGSIVLTNVCQTQWKFAVFANLRSVHVFAVKRKAEKKLPAAKKQCVAGKIVVTLLIFIFYV